MKKYKHTTFLGDKMGQTVAEFNAWEEVLRDRKFARIIEFGTWKGGLAFYLCMFAMNREADFITYDINSPEKTVLRDMFAFEASFKKKDIFTDVKNIKAEITSPGRTVLFCDGGDKTREFKLFSPVLKIGEIGRAACRERV